MRLIQRQGLGLRQARGATLIEVMIALLILGIGLLGLGALQSFALQSSQIASQRTLATTLAARVADEYRSYRSLAQPPQVLRDDWDAEAANLLPNGTVTTVRTVDTLTITVNWQDDREIGGPEDGDAIVFVTRI